ncbi:MAG: methyltransferase domain-containing protein [Chloroflexi bacterium]|nr:methyltransferase domain-containing protein [Chloroflexota bacterium]
MRLPNETLDEAQAKACCADLYQSDLARLILGETLHPGGLALTNRLGRLMGIQRDDWVVDLASGRGVSAMAVSRAFHCRVAGVEFSRAATAGAAAASRAAPVASQACFLQGDAENPPLASSRFDAVLCECSMSIFPDKSRAVQEMRRLLRPGGRLGLSDVTVEPGCLPEELEGNLGQVLCLSGALSVNGYRQLLQNGGLELQHQEDASVEILKLLEDLESKLAMVKAWGSGFSAGIPQIEAMQSAPELLRRLKSLVQDGKLGYWLFVACNQA